MRFLSLIVTSLLIVTGCATPSARTEAPGHAQAPAAAPVRLGEPIGTTPPITLAALAKTPDAYKDQVIVTSGTVTAVCEAMGCWMELEDASSNAHIKIAGMSFVIPQSSKGRSARLRGTLVAGEGAKLTIEATGVEID